MRWPLSSNRASGSPPPSDFRRLRTTGWSAPARATPIQSMNPVTAIRRTFAGARAGRLPQRKSRTDSVNTPMAARTIHDERGGAMRECAVFPGARRGRGQLGAYRHRHRRNVYRPHRRGARRTGAGHPQARLHPGRPVPRRHAGRRGTAAQGRPRFRRYRVLLPRHDRRHQCAAGTQGRQDRADHDPRFSRRPAHRAQGPAVQLLALPGDRPPEPPAGAAPLADDGARTGPRARRRSRSAAQ